MRDWAVFNRRADVLLQNVILPERKLRLIGHLPVVLVKKRITFVFRHRNADQMSIIAAMGNGRIVLAGIAQRTVLNTLASRAVDRMNYTRSTITVGVVENNRIASGGIETDIQNEDEKNI